MKSEQCISELFAENSGLRAIQIPVLQDNYIYLLHAEATGETAVVDPAVAAPVREVLQRKNWRLTDLFNTHHHGDHVGGNRELKQATGCEITGFGPDAARIPDIDRKMKEGEVFQWGGADVQVLFLPGHTLGHIAYYFPREKWLFCGDVLFLMGCGRLFEGTPQQAYESLNKLKALPDATLIFCAHEYTEHNGEFALTVEPENQDLQQRMAQVRALRGKHRPTVPATLAAEKATNPFLRTGSKEIRAGLGLENAPEADVFAALREQRNGF